MEPGDLRLQLRVQGQTPRQVDLQLIGRSGFLPGPGQFEHLSNDGEVLPGDSVMFVGPSGRVVGHLRVRSQVSRLTGQIENGLLQRSLRRPLTEGDSPQLGDILGQPGFQAGQTPAGGELEGNSQRGVGQQPGLHDVGPGHPDLHERRLQRGVVEQANLDRLVDRDALAKQFLHPLGNRLVIARLIDLFPAGRGGNMPSGTLIV